MKKIILIALCLISTTSIFAQKFASVDTEYILSNMPEYKQAQKELDDMAVQWQKEVESKFQIVDKLYKAFQAESVLLPEELKTKKENEIIAAEKEAKDMQKQRFGNSGDLSKKRSELVKPIQDKVYNAIEKIAQEKNYAIIFDKSSGASILYVDAKTDVSDLVLAELGYKISGSRR
ncbi:MAG: OmpH family outer membrane protein [Bacteroidales bacterium]|jgi:outer membrane protein|nr:OmpH family outer membrane protein [Bacteroidales bacterium]MDD4703986.1 OmpH family outer membrane protein [Bacteroidales bacterium]MDX9798977.1 OmpH family outer membrane protein [Bacteroidales bacterium]